MKQFTQTAVHRGAVTVLGVVLVSLAACANSSTPDPPAAQAVSLPPGVARQAVSLIDAFALGNASLATIRERVGARARQCMQAAGFPYQDPSQVAVIGIQGGTVADYLAYAHTKGYGIAIAAEGASAAAPQDANLDYMERLSADQRAEYWEALTGTPAQPAVDTVELPLVTTPTAGAGCLPRAVWSETHELPFFDQRLGPMIKEFKAHELGGAPLRVASKSWAGCMDRHGYPLSEYDDAASDYINRAAAMSTGMQLAEASNERAMASRDAECYVEAMHSVRRHAETDFLVGLGKTDPRVSSPIATVLRDW